jgi:hypothetical protein
MLNTITYTASILPTSPRLMMKSAANTIYSIAIALRGVSRCINFFTNQIYRMLMIDSYLIAKAQRRNDEMFTLCYSPMRKNLAS